LSCLWCCDDSFSPFSAEHKRHMPSCPFLKIKDPYDITVGDVLDLEKKAFEYAIVSLANSCCAKKINNLE